MNFISIKTLFFAIVIIFIFQFLDKDSEKFEGGFMLAPDTKIVAFGDSITYGHGLAREKSYPSILETLLGTAVINEGISGETSTRGLQRLPQVLENHKPQILIICHGGNDILQKSSLVTAKENIAKMIQLAKQKNIHVILVGVPKFEILTLSTAEFYYELSKEFNVPLEDTVLEQVLDNPEFKLDKVHPNEAGYRMLANKLASIVANTYIPSF